VKASERHRLKHDKYAESVVGGLAWAQQHQNVIAAAVVAVLVVGGGILWMTWTRRAATASAADILTEVQNRAQMALLEAPEKRNEAVSQALSGYDSLAATYPETSSAVLGLIQAGDLLVQSGKPAEAIAYYERALAAASGKLAGLKDLARHGLAVACESKGDYLKAIEYYSYFADDPASLEGVRANWDIGRCYELLGEADRARVHYEKAAQYGEDSEWAQMARFRVSELARGPVSSVPPATPSVPAASATPEEESGAPASAETKESASPAPPAAPETSADVQAEETPADVPAAETPGTPEATAQPESTPAAPE
jgi:tetratricopeptide (TPR) repeat protein